MLRHWRKVHTGNNEEGLPPPPHSGESSFKFRHPFTMTASGPTGCGKSYFLKDMLQQIHTICEPSPQRIVWLYKRWQPLYDVIQNTVHPPVEFHRGIPYDLDSDSFFDSRVRNMIVLDDLMSTAARDSRINDLFTEGSHHRNLSVVAVNQNLYFGKDPTQRRNCHYLVLFNNPIDQQPIMTLGRQMYPGRWQYFMDRFAEATAKPYGYLLVDLKPDTSHSLRLRTDVLNTSKKEVTMEREEGNRMRTMAVQTDPEEESSESEEERDLLACEECGVVFAHARGLHNHVTRGCSYSPSKRRKPDVTPMNNVQLEDVLEDFPVTVCCADDLPASVEERPCSFVVNTDSCDQPGTHWVVFHFNTDGPAEFFDSLGQPPETYHKRFQNVLVVNGPNYVFTNYRIQPYDSDTCGLYCIYFIRQRYRGYSMEDVLKEFSKSDLEHNDRKIVRLSSLYD